MTHPANTIYLVPGNRAWNRFKNPDDVSDIRLDWTQFLESAESVASVTTSAKVVTVASSTYSGKTTTHFISGGNDGERGYVDVKIVTDNATPRTYQVRINYKIEESAVPTYQGIWGW